MIETLFPQGPWHYLAGGLLIGSAIGALYLLAGLVGGLSTFFSSTLSWVSRLPSLQQAKLLDSRGWRLAYAGGLVLGGAIFALTLGDFGASTRVPPWLLLVGGLLIGFGARLSDGCTAGHGICGLASLRWPSLLAVVTFLSTAIVVAQVVAHFGVLP